MARRAISSAIRRLAVGADGTSGNALVEFAIFAPILLGVAIYTMDWGLIVISKMEVQNAAQAGAQYAIVNSTYDATSISSAVTKATKFTAVTPTSSQFCGCPSTTGITFCSASCDTCNPGTCSSNSQGHYVTVSATPTTPYQTLIPYALVPSGYNLAAQSTVRIR